MPKLESLVQTPVGAKQFKAVFRLEDDRTKTVRFGTASNYALDKEKTDVDRDAYIARHQVREDFNAPMTAGALSRWVLWGKYHSWKVNAAQYRKQFKL